MNPERAQMLREIRREYCEETCPSYEDCAVKCPDFVTFIEDLFAEAESQTEPENENETV